MTTRPKDQAPRGDLLSLGLIGLGQMGHRMARHLSADGYRLVVADAISTDLAPATALKVKTNGRVGALASIVLLSLPDGETCLDVARQLIAEHERQVDLVIDSSTIGIKAAKAMAATLAEAGIDYIDAPVSGGIAGADAGSLSVIIACRQTLFDRVSPILSSIGGHLFHVGDSPGMGQAAKLLNNFLSATAMAATSEAMAFGVAEGLDMRTILAVVNRSSGQNTASRDKFPSRILTESYDGGFAAAMMAKDVELYMKEVETNAAPTHLAPTVQRLWSAFDRAEPGADFTRIYPFIKAPSPKNGDDG